MRLPEPEGAEGGGPRVSRADLRSLTLGAVAWSAALAALLLPGRVLAACAAVTALALVAGVRRSGRLRPEHAAWVGVAVAAAASVLVRGGAVTSSPVHDLALERASVTLTVVLRSDPVVRHGRFGDIVVVRGSVREVSGRGRRHEVRAPVVVLADDDWRPLRLGATVRTGARLAPADGDDLAAMVSARGRPEVVRPPPPLLGGAERVRAGIRDAAAPMPAVPRALVPALVDGDDGALSQDVQDDFRSAGLTHLLAVSGTNLTLVVGFLLVLARWAGVRARGLVVVGALGVVGFVLLARAEPSVVRAAAMGSVALSGLGASGPGRGVRALGVAVLVLMLFDPGLATSAGFALSAGATAGILLLAPPWRDALMRWLPRPVAEAVAVPLAAQLACTPLVAAISGQVSLVAVVANLLVAAAVGPATVLGLAGGLVAVLAPAAGALVAAPAGWCAAWIVVVSGRAAALPVADVGWGTSGAAIAGLTLLCAALALVAAPVLSHRWSGLAAAVVMVVSVLVPLPTPGWPPRGWVMVMCDVGQGDGLVLSVAPGSALVVDAGPDPRLIDRCLTRLGVEEVPLVVLTHFHADHVNGLAGVLAGRRVGAVEVSFVDQPRSGADMVAGVAQRARVPVVEATYGVTRRLGDLTLQVVAPSEPPPPGSASAPDDASVVLVVGTQGLRLLLMGDEEGPSQARLAEVVPDLHVDVLKVAHHGSAKQDPDLVRSLGARLALVSVGADNGYGHPAPSTIRMLREAGMSVRRTDHDGDVAVVADHGRLRVTGS